VSAPHAFTCLTRSSDNIKGSDVEAQISQHGSRYQ